MFIDKIYKFVGGGSAKEVMDDSKIATILGQREIHVNGTKKAEYHKYLE